MPDATPALLYPSAGCKIVFVYGTDGKRCDCHPLCYPQNHGKHPVTNHNLYPGFPEGLSPRAVYSATDDPVRIQAAWDAYHAIHGHAPNIGLACGEQGGNLACLDIDAPAVGKAILGLLARQFDPEDPGSWATVNSVDGTRIHVWCRYRTASGCRTLKLADGTVLGELRENGQYAVCPPSLHRSGQQRRYVLGGIGDLPEVESAYDYLLSLLTPLGVALAPPSARRSPTGRGDGDGVAAGSLKGITEDDFPFDPQGLPQMRQFLTGTMPELAKEDGSPDRSKTLAWGSYLIVEGAHQKDYELEVDTLAGILKGVDAVAYHKYTYRSDGDKRYRDLALDAFAKVETGEDDREGSMAAGDGETEEATTASSPQDAAGAGGAKGKRKRGQKTATRPPDERYRWDQRQGLIAVEGRREWPVANFLLTYEHEYEVDQGQGDPKRYADLRLHPLEGDDQVVTFDAKELSSEIMLRERLAHRVGFHGYVHARQWSHLLPAAAILSKPWPIERQAGRTGWSTLTPHDLFMLPSAPAAIGPDGWDTSIRFSQHLPDHMELLHRYGKGVNLCTTAEEFRAADRALLQVLRCGDPLVTVPILTGVLGGPLFNLGLSASPPLLHFYGKTNSYKTTVITTMLCAFGTFEALHGNTAWTSSFAHMQQRLWLLRDLPLLIDDYKPAQVPIETVIRMVQNYGDGTARGRQNRDMTEQQGFLPAALFLSTGEETWSHEESVATRTVFIPVARDEEATAEHPAVVGSLPKGLVWPLQDLRLSGILGYAGGTYLQALTRLGQEALRQQIAHAREEALTQLSGAAGSGVQPRSLNNRASLRAAEAVIAAVLAAIFPETAAAYGDLVQQTRMAVLQQLREDAADAVQLSPLNTLLDALTAQLTAGQIHMAHWDEELEKAGDLVGDPYKECVGFYDDDGIYLLENATWTWYQKWRRQQGRSSGHWKAVIQEARQTFGSGPVFRVAEQVRRPHGKSGLRPLILPRTALDLTQAPSLPRNLRFEE